MTIVCCRFVGVLALVALLMGGVSCAQTRPPTYVYTPAPGETVEIRSRRSTEPGTSPHATSHAARQEFGTPELLAMEQDAQDENGRRGFFGRFRRVDEGNPLEETLADHDGTDVPSIAAQNEIRHVLAGYRLQINDPIVVQLRGIPESANYEMVVDDRGDIHLPYIPPVRAEGRSPSELQRELRDVYINEQIYRHITVHVMLPTQSYFVRGEVRQPGRFPLTSGMTVLKAIAAAGGYSEFANPRRINIIRDGETMIENARQMEQNPEDDLDVKAGDVIIVPRSIF